MTLEEAIHYAEDLGTEEENKIDYDKDTPHTIIRKKNTVKDYRQLAEWLRELKEAKRLLKAAVEALNDGSCNKDCRQCENHKSCDYDNRFKWKYTNEVLKLIGEGGDPGD